MLLIFDISCHNLELEMKNYQLRYALAIVSSWDGTANQGSLWNKGGRAIFRPKLLCLKKAV